MKLGKNDRVKNFLTNVISLPSQTHVLWEAVPERHFRFEDIKATVQMLIDLVDGGYRIGMLGDMDKHSQQQLKTIEEVLRANLVYDMRDAIAYSKRELGCPADSALQKFVAWMHPCGIALPEDASPHSLRSTIGHNTNLWLGKGGPLPGFLSGSVGIIKLGAPANKYFVDANNNSWTLGMGSRVCDHMSPEVQVSHTSVAVNLTFY